MSPAPQSRMLAERGTSLTCSQMHTNTCASATCLPLRASPRAWRRLAPPWSWSLLGVSAQQAPALAKRGESAAPPLKHHRSSVRDARG